MSPPCRLAFLFLLTLSGCASSPPALVALPSAPVSASEASTVERPGPSVLVRRVIVPGYLDGIPVVVGRKGTSLVLAERAEWAERLSEGVTRVLRDALTHRLGPSRVLIEGDGRIPDADLTVELLALDPEADGQLRLDARWTFLGSAGERASHAGRTRLAVPLDSPTAPAVASAMAQALGQLADALAMQSARIRAR